MKKLFLGVIAAILLASAMDSNVITEYPPNPHMTVQIIYPEAIRNLPGEYTHVYIKGDRVKINTDDANYEISLDRVIIIFDKDNGNIAPNMK